MAIPTFNVGGLVSGLDTNSIVSQLMQLERRPIYQLEGRKSDIEARNRAWSQISTRMNAVQDKLKALDGPDDWRKFASVTSSNEDAVKVTTSGTANIGSASFTVDRLAATHQVASTGTFASMSDLVGVGDFTITDGNGTDHTITTTASTTVSDLANQIEALDADISASLIFTDSSTAKLVVSANESGADASFTTSTTIGSLAGFSVVEQGVDSQLTVGSGPGALTIERASNEINDFISGATITLKSTTTEKVDVSVTRDTEAAVTAVKELVDELNKAISSIAGFSKAGSEDTEGGPLALDATARNLALNLRSSLSGVVSSLGGTYNTTSSVGLSITRDGSYTLDETKLREALEDDFGSVADLFQHSTSATDSRVSVTRTGDSAMDGTYGVEITQAATKAAFTGISYPASMLAQSFTITTGTTAVNVSISADAPITDAIDAINQALGDAGITTITATNDGGAIKLASSVYGSNGDFTVSANDLGLDGTHAGLNIAGTINGVAATGNGQSLSGTGDLDGLILKITASAAEVSGAGGTLALGTISSHSGLAATIGEYFESVTESGGTIDRATDRWDSQLDLIKARIEQLEERMDSREASLRRQYTAMETTLARLNSSTVALFAALPQGNQ